MYFIIKHSSIIIYNLFNVLIGDVHRVDEIIPSLVQIQKQLLSGHLDSGTLLRREGFLNFLKLLVRLLDFEVCSDSLLCPYPLLQRLDGYGFFTVLLIILVTKPLASSLILTPFCNGFYLLQLESGIVCELVITWPD